MQSASKLAVFLLVLALFAASSPAQTPYWAAKYPRFGGGKSTADLEVVTHRFFDQTVRQQISVDARTFPEALEQVRAALRKAHAEFGLGFTMSHADFTGYFKPYHLHARQIVLAAVIDRLAAQGGLFWDFSAAGMLNFYPPKSP